MALRIPQSQIEAFKLFAALKDEDLDAVWRALQTSEPAISVVKLAQNVLSKVDIEIGQLRQIISVAGSLYLVRDQEGLTIDQLADAAVTAAVKQSLLPSDDTDQAEKLKERVAKFMSLDRSLGVSAKATQVLVRHKNPFESARIFTDVRPIFTPGENPVPTAAVCFHTLELITVTDGARLSHYIALDSGDLRRLRTVIERAISKEDSIKRVMQTLPLVEIQDTEE